MRQIIKKSKFFQIFGVLRYEISLKFYKILVSKILCTIKSLIFYINGTAYNYK